jgi:hypothetical protein
MYTVRIAFFFEDTAEKRLELKPDQLKPDHGARKLRTGARAGK